MTIAVANTTNSQSFGAWLTTTNRLASIISSNAVTVDLSTSGSVSTGNAYVNGHFGSQVLYSNTILGGSPGNTNPNIAIGSKIFISNTGVSVNTSLFVTNNVLTITNTASATSLTISPANTTVIANGQFFLNANSAWSAILSQIAGSNTQIQFNSSNNFAGSANLTFISTTDRLSVGGSTTNTVVQPGNVTISNTSVSLSMTLPTTVQTANGAFYLNANGAWSQVKAGAGYYKGNAGAAGDPGNAQNLYRINANTQTANVTIVAGENAQVTGPISIANGFVLQIDSGARVSIV